MQEKQINRKRRPIRDNQYLLPITYKIYIYLYIYIWPMAIYGWNGGQKPVT